MQDRLRLVKEQDKEILLADFSDFRESEMIQLMTKLMDRMIANRNINRLLIVCNEKNYFTPQYMQSLRSYRVEERNFNAKIAVIGFNDVQKVILKGYNMYRGKNFSAFNSREEALKYLLAE